jgi:hypothetical protein
MCVRQIPVERALCAKSAQKPSPQLGLLSYYRQEAHRLWLPEALRWAWLNLNIALASIRVIR